MGSYGGDDGSDEDGEVSLTNGTVRYRSSLAHQSSHYKVRNVKRWQTMTVHDDGGNELSFPNEQQGGSSLAQHSTSIRH